jgi:hypothetical protein
MNKNNKNIANIRYKTCGGELVWLVENLAVSPIIFACATS